MLSDQIGYGSETTWATAAAISRHLPLLEESLSQEIGRIESEGIIAGARTRRSGQWAPGNKTVSGDVSHELYDRQLGILFLHMFGAVATTGVAAPFTHTFTPGSLKGKGLTVEIGREDTTNTLRRFLYAGCKVASWEIGCSEGEIATLGLTLVGRTEATGGTLSVPAYGAGLIPLSFNHGTLSIDGNQVASITAATVNGDNGLAAERRFFSQAGLIAEPTENELRTYGGSLTSEFDSMANYDRYIAGTEHALVLRFLAGTNEVRLEANIRYDGETPNAGGRAIPTQDLAFTALGPTGDAGAMTAVLVNGDATP
jgi:hypothetical protein